MIDMRPFTSLGRVDAGWLTARHHFSFGHYFDPDRLHWGALRVWNDDRIEPHTGFGRHPHRDMEIITYVRNGAISHRDSLGNAGRTVAGDIQVMSAGSGIEHEEMNHEDDVTELFQIWLLPRENGGAPRWETAQFPKSERAGRLITLASGREDRSQDVPLIRQDAALLGATLTAGQSVVHALEPGRHAYLVPAEGRITVNGHEARPRDGIAVRDEDRIEIRATTDSEIVLVDTI